MHRRSIASYSIAIFVAVGLVFAMFASSAFADAEGKCGGHVTTGAELYDNWLAEGVTSQAAEVVKSAGFYPEDNALRPWMKERVVKVKTAQAVNLHDFGCRDGVLFSVGNRHFAKGVSIMAALPMKYSKADYCGVKARKGCERVKVWVQSVGKVNCSNPLEGGFWAVIYVKKGKHKPKPKPDCKKCKPGKPKPPNIDVDVVADCSNVNVIVGNGNTVNQGGNCPVTVTPPPSCHDTGTCPPPPPPPPSCHDTGTCPSPPSPPIVEWERIQEVYTDHERNLCVTVTPATGASVQFGVKWGARSNGGKGVYNANTNKYCVTYTSPSEEPPHTCVEPISDKLPPGTKCDIANVAVTSSNGAKTVTATMEIPILEEDKVVVW